MKRRISGYRHGLCLTLCVSAYSGNALAGPVGGEVVGGSGSITQSGLTTTINQASQNLATNWQSFDVNSNERVQFIQPNSTSIALNRILSNNGSTIAGRIDANGKIILVNPNGILFTPTASLNVGSIIASGLDMSPNDFMNGKYIFNEIPGSNGAVINNGMINAALGGNVALLGKQVQNTGLISATLGSVTLASGKQAVLTFDNGGLLGVRVSEAMLQKDLGVDPAVMNSGTIQAQGGRVLLTASVSQDVFSKAVNTSGVEPATSVVVAADGTFTLGGGADVVNTGHIDTSAAQANENGGRIVLLGQNVTSSGTLKANAASGNGGEIELHAKDTTLLTQNSLTSARAETNGQGGIVKVLGDKVGLFDQAAVDVSGAVRGGKTLIGGDKHGDNPVIRNARFTYLSDQSQVTADGLDTGHGGRIITFATDTARIDGNLRARGGVNGGNGGFIETSGLRGFEIRSAPDVGASHGTGGLWLIDPYDLTISANGTSNINNNPANFFTSTGTGANLDVATIRDALITGDVTVQTTPSPSPGAETGNITFLTGTLLSYNNRGSRTLTVDSAGGITFQAGSQIYDSTPANNTTDVLNINLFATGAVVLNGADTVNTLPAANITTQGGYFHVGSSTRRVASFTNDGTVATDGLPTQNGGDVAIYTTGVLTTTGLNTDGGLATRNSAGHNGGDLLLNASAGPITVNGALQTLGSDGNASGSTNYNGGDAGAVTLTAPAGIALTGDVIATGGLAANTGRSGIGGTVTVTGATTLNSVGGTRVDTTGSAMGNITFNNTLDGPGGLQLTGQDITFNGAVGAATRLGDITVTAFGNVNAGTHSMTATSLTAQSVDYTSGALNTAATAGNGGNVSITASRTATVGGIQTSTSGSSASGGAITLTAAAMTLNGDINASGSVSPTAHLTVTATGGSVTLNNPTNYTTGVSIAATDGSLAATAHRDNTWVINGPNAGTVNTNVHFTGMKNLSGADGVDTVTVSSAGSLTGYLDGGGTLTPTPSDSVTFQQAGGTTVQLLAAAPTPAYTSPANTVSLYRIGAVTAAGSHNTLIGANVANVTNQWSITGSNTGSLNAGSTTAFTNFDTLTGSAGQDIFTFTALGHVTGLINGGGGTTDVLDLQALTSPTSVQLFDAVPASVTNPAGTLAAYHLATIQANPAVTNTLLAANGTNDWRITGPNAGALNDGVFTTGFAGFGALTGGTGDDTFTLSGSGSLTGAVRGDPSDSTTGRDQLRVTLSGTPNGEVNYLGNGHDSVTLSGGTSTYTGVYTPSVTSALGTFDQLSYSAGSSPAFTTRYANVAALTDNVTASALTVNGGGNAFGSLRGNTVSVGSGTAFHTAIAYTLKDNLIVQDVPNVLINDNLNIPNTVLTVRNATTLQPATDTVITAGGLVLDTITSLPALLTTQIDSLGLMNLGAVTLTNTGSLRLDTLSALTGPVNLTASGDLTSSNQVHVVDSAFSLTAAGNIDFTQGENSLSGPISLSGNAVSLTNTRATTLAGVSANTLAIDSVGALSDTGPVTVATGNVALTSAEDITLTHLDQITTGSMRAPHITLHTLNGIGTGTDYIDPVQRLTTTTTTLDVTNQNGNVFIVNHGPVSVSLITQGDIHLTNDAPVTVRQLNANGGKQDANAPSLGGSIFLATSSPSTVDGSAYGNPATTTDNKYKIIPDIVAENFTGLLLTGSPHDMGQPGRPMSVMVRNLFYLRADNAYLYYFLPKPSHPQVNATLFEYVDVKNLSELLINIESLGDFDPAIFTAVRNYYYEDVAINMPADQRVEGPDTDGGDDADDDLKKRQRLPEESDTPSATPPTTSSP